MSKHQYAPVWSRFLLGSLIDWFQGKQSPPSFWLREVHTKVHKKGTNSTANGMKIIYSLLLPHSDLKNAHSKLENLTLYFLLSQDFGPGDLRTPCVLAFAMRSLAIVITNFCSSFFFLSSPSFAFDTLRGNSRVRNNSPPPHLFYM